MLKKSLFLVVGLIWAGTVTLFAGGDLQKVIEGLPERGDGAFLRTYPDGFRIFSIGTAAIDDPNDADCVLRAEKVASLNARRAISEYITQALSSQTAMSDAFEKAETVQENDGAATKATHTMTQEAFAEEISVGSAAIMRGVVTLKVIQFTKGNNIFSRVLVGYSSKTLNALHTSEANGGVEAQPMEALNKEGEDAMIAPVEKEEEWILCIGHGKDRKLAIQAAILEGIQQVYGVYLENSETYKSRFTQLKTKMNGEETKNNDSFSEQTQDALTQTRGFVDAYRIVSVEVIEVGMEAKIQAKFVNPRVGGLKAIMIYPMEMPLSKQINLYTVGPKKRISGKELGGICSRRLEKAFSKANKYLVLNVDDMAEAIRQHKLTKELVDGEHASPAELAKAGKLLTADYILNSTFDNFVYTRKLDFNKKTRKMEPVERVVFTFEYSLFDVKTAARCKQNIINVVLNNEVISTLRAEDEECTEEEFATKLFETAMYQAAAVLAEEVKF